MRKGGFRAECTDGWWEDFPHISDALKALKRHVKEHRQRAEPVSWTSMARP